ncbi:MAG: SAVED domain-containing protein [Ferrovibrio sp.]
MQAVLDFIRDVLDPIGIVVGLLVAVPIFWTWWQIVFGERRQRRRWLAEVSQQPGERPGILIIDLLPGKDIQTCVRRHIAADAKLMDIPADRCGLIQRDQPLRPEQVADYAAEVRRACRRLLDAGCDVIHVFYSGPIVAGFIAGAEMSNGPRTQLYHFEQGQYINFGPLEPLRYSY